MAAVYRGWLLRAEEYLTFEAALAERSVTLRTGARHYREAHELPGWYAKLISVTPESVWTRGASPDEFRACCKAIGRGTGRASRLFQIDEALLARGCVHSRRQRSRCGVEDRRVFWSCVKTRSRAVSYCVGSNPCAPMKSGPGGSMVSACLRLLTPIPPPGMCRRASTSPPSRCALPSSRFRSSRSTWHYAMTGCGA